jgi:hypothetical protein
MLSLAIQLDRRSNCAPKRGYTGTILFFALSGAHQSCSVSYPRKSLMARDLHLQPISTPNLKFHILLPLAPRLHSAIGLAILEEALPQIHGQDNPRAGTEVQSTPTPHDHNFHHNFESHACSPLTTIILLTGHDPSFAFNRYCRDSNTLSRAAIHTQPNIQSCARKLSHRK